MTGDLPDPAGRPASGGRRPMPADGPFDPRRIRAVTFDFGDTLVVVPGDAFRAVVAGMAGDACAHLRLGEAAGFLRAWGEERDRQLVEDVAAGREMDMGRRVARVVARMRSVPAPPPGRPWDERAVDAVVEPTEVDWTLARYRDRWLAGIPVPAGVVGLLARLAADRRIGIVSNWPHAPTIRAQVDAAGWSPYLTAVVISSEVGAIKPDVAIFRAAETALGLTGTAAGSILHVGDDRRADVAGARRAGWRAAWLRSGNPGSPLPGAGRAPDPDDPEPDLEIETLEELLDVLAEPPAAE